MIVQSKLLNMRDSKSSNARSARLGRPGDSKGCVQKINVAF